LAVVYARQRVLRIERNGNLALTLVESGVISASTVNWSPETSIFPRLPPVWLVVKSRLWADALVGRAGAVKRQSFLRLQRKGLKSLRRKSLI
jgi:hypothetical protein